MRVDFFAGIDAPSTTVAESKLRSVGGAPATSFALPPGLSRSAPLLGRVIAGRYEIEAILGRGSTSIVCRASCLDDGLPVAIKVLSPMSAELIGASVSDRFRFEAHALAEMRHPNVVSVLDFGATDDGLLYTVMELLAGQTLRRLLASEDRLPPGRAVRIACGVARGLQALHERGLLHRDVKPANIYVGCDWQGAEVIKLMDLGLARSLGSSPAIAGDEQHSDVRPRRRLNTQEGLILGTGAYMSPELIQGDELDARSDLYALGVVTYRMLTGTLPFTGSDLPHLLLLHLSEPVESTMTRAPSAAIPVALDRVVLRALEKDPEWRPQTASDFARELTCAVAENGDEAAEDHAVAASVRGESQSGRLRIVRTVVGAVVFLAAALASYALVRRIGAHRSEHVASAAGITTRAGELRHANAALPLARSAPTVSPRWDVAAGGATFDAPPHAFAALRHARATEPVRSTAPVSTQSTSAHRADDLKVPIWNR